MSFVAWLEFYYNIYNSPDRPKDSIIEDDRQLDLYLRKERIRKKHESNSTDRAAGRKGGFEH